MTWDDALKVGLVVIASLGGGAGIVAGFFGFSGRVWADRLAERQRLASEAELTNMRGRFDDALARLNAGARAPNVSPPKAGSTQGRGRSFNLEIDGWLTFAPAASDRADRGARGGLQEMFAD
jgi:hypothetical protein